MNNTSVDSYLEDGCGRCDRYKTPECKVHLWTEALLAMRELLRETELAEDMKWGSPCYTLGGKNVIMIVSRSEYCALSFFKGVALEDDDEGVLEKPGPNTRKGRLFKFTSLDEFTAQRELARRLIQKAIDVERSGEKIEVEKEPEPMPEELEQRLANDDELKRAFEALTPGRKRSHILYVGGAKKSETRQRRVERCAPKIVAGKGYNEY